MISTSVSAGPETSTPAAINNTFVWMIASAGALGGLLFGYDWVVIGGAKPFYEKFFALTDPSSQGWAMSCALIGCFLGAVVSGKLSDAFGRKRPMIVAATIFALSSLGTALANHFAVFILWRIFGGVAIGLASSLAPMYIAEIAPAAQRGRLVSLNQFTIVIGILLAQLANWRIAQPVPFGASADQILHSWNGQTGWRVMFAVTAIPSLLYLLAVIFVPESPRWLLQKRRSAEAHAVLSRIGGPAYADTLSQQIASVTEGSASASSSELLSHPKLRRILVLGLVLAVLQQWCGINVVFNYAEEVFSAAGYQVSDILFNIVVTGAVNVVFTLVAFGTVDRFGRRSLMLIGSCGLAIIYAVLGFLYYLHAHGMAMLLLVVLAIGCYAMSLAPVTWVLISEIFPDRVRSQAMSIAITALWIASFVLTYSFPFLNRSLGAAGTFGIYSAICAVSFVYLFARLPETRQRSLEEIEKSWN